MSKSLAKYLLYVFRLNHRLLQNIMIFTFFLQ
jgi:hypothetical protein